MSKGQGSTVQVMIAVLVVAILGLFLFVTQTSTTAENIGDLASSSAAYREKVTALSVYDVSYITVGRNNPRLSWVLAHACEYGKPTKDYRFTVSDDVPVRFETRTFLEDYLNRTITGKYYFYMDCEENQLDDVSRKIVAGIQPPDGENVIVSSIDIPLARGNRTEAFLFRWQ